MKKTLLIGLMSLTVLSACGQINVSNITGGARPVFDGQRFRSNVERNRDDIAALIVTVRPVSRSLNGALEAGRYEATKHCIRYFGNSRVEWEVGPDSELQDLIIDDDRLTLIGRCEGERS